MPKLSINLNEGSDRQRVIACGARVLADYRDSMVVQATDEQHQTLQAEGLEVKEMASRPVQMAALSFNFAEAMDQPAPASAAAISDNRTQYYLLQLVAPSKPDWMKALSAAGVRVVDSLPGDYLLVGMTRQQRDLVQSLPWVEGISSYLPGMKVHASLRVAPPGMLNAAALAAPQALESVDAKQVALNVFPGEGTQGVAEDVRNQGGHVLSEHEHTVVAVVKPDAIPALAANPRILSILPHAWPKTTNDVAKPIMGVPANQQLGGQVLFGEGQLVAVADSGLDSGNINTLHPDFAGRVEALVSSNPAIPPGFAFPRAQGGTTPAWTITPVNDGPADTHSGHGTHVAGSVLGDGAVARAAQQPPQSLPIPSGIASRARLFFQAVGIRVAWKSRQQLINEGVSQFFLPPDWPPEPETLFGLPANLRDLFEPAYNAGARIHTNSWGSDVSGVYTDNSAEVDDFMWRHRDFLALFSAGNAGVDDGAGSIQFGSVGSPATSKNCLTVGASENGRPPASTPPPGLNRRWRELRWPSFAANNHVSDDPNEIAAFSSRGPVDGVTGGVGRIKPDVVAPGTNILSTRTSAIPASDPILWGELPSSHPLRGRYVWSGGTSMSTPIVAGAVTVVRQFLVTVRGHFQPGLKPSGALIKAMVVNGADIINGTNAGAQADNSNGFGRVSLEGAIRAHAATTLFVDEPDHAVATGEIARYRLSQVSDDAPLVVTLVWTDAPSAPGMGSLTNQLYLTIRDSNGQIVEGDLTPAPQATNNVQRIFVEDPIAGEYQIRVKGESVIKPPPWMANPDGVARQDFAIVASQGSSIVRLS